MLFLVLVLSDSFGHLGVAIAEVISIAWIQFRLHTALEIVLQMLVAPWHQFSRWWKLSLRGKLSFHCFF